MRNQALTLLLLVGIALLIALSVVNLLVSKNRNEQIDRLVADRITWVMQSPDFQKMVVDSIPPAQSVQGEPGQSVTGPRGLTGKNGKDGVMGKDGKDGKNGKSAYDIWVAQGNVGTEQDFLASLVGPRGDQGAPGEVQQLQWSGTGVLESKYSGDDFWITVPKVLP